MVFPKGTQITGSQIRAARALIRWSAEDLARKSRLGVATIRRAEAEDTALSITAANADAIQRALEAGGIVFVPENGGGVGVRLKQPTVQRPR
jgi:transcriptional regulator with XRE-family HTH domain